MPDLLPRRRLLLASATTLPLLFAAAGCRSSDAFAGPDPLSGRPPLSHDVVTLQAVITAEQALVAQYRAAIAGRSAAAPQASVLEPLLSQHEQHLAWLRARLVIPSGAAPSASPSASATPAGPVTTATLRAAEHASATSLVQKLATVQPSLAQLFASIAASDATHVAVLGG
ncbi:MAG: hypothetical protein WAK82_18575 [Streptosporangiaceae bacterium]